MGRTADILPVYGDDYFYEHYLSLGLGVFHTFLTASHKDRLHIMRENVGVSYSSLSSALEEEGPWWDNPLCDAWQNKAFLGFCSDDDRDGPNAAWVWSTENKVELEYYQSDKGGLRKWGYVMWDKDRLDPWTILEKKPHHYFVQEDRATLW